MIERKALKTQKKVTRLHSIKPEDWEEAHSQTYLDFYWNLVKIYSILVGFPLLFELTHLLYPNNTQLNSLRAFIGQLFGGSANFWQIIIGMITASGIIFSILWQSADKLSKERTLRRNLYLGVYQELLQNLELIFLGDFESLTDKVIFKKVKTNLEVVQDMQTFNIISKIYSYSYDYENIIKNKTDFFISEKKTKLIIKVIEELIKLDIYSTNEISQFNSTKKVFENVVEHKRLTDFVKDENHSKTRRWLINSMFIEKRESITSILQKKVTDVFYSRNKEVSNL